MSDVDRAKRFHLNMGWRLDADFANGDSWRVVQVTPPGSPFSIHFGKGVTTAVPGSVKNLYLVVSDVEAARGELIGRGVDVSEAFHFTAFGGPPAPGPSVGWYTVRVIGVLSSSLVLIVLLYEIEILYARLLGAVLAQRREREARLMTGDAVAASIAHEVKQPLTAMIMSADAGFRFLDRSPPNLDRAKETFRLIATDGHRAGEVVENIRANFRSDVLTRTSLDVNELIREALVLERTDLEKHRIVVQAEPNKRLPEVRGNRVQLQQVLLNLIANAIHAMAAKDEPRVLCVKSEAYEADRVVVSVADTGTEVSPQDIDRLFTPLFTTKSDGMGMGLSICRAIIEAHNGRLWFSPNTPRGAVFQFTLHASNPATVAV